MPIISYMFNLLIEVKQLLKLTKEVKNRLALTPAITCPQELVPRLFTGCIPSVARVRCIASLGS